MPKANVLLVDDERDFIEAMGDRLEIRGYQVFRSLTGEDALANLEKEPDIDVTILDLKLPGMGGIEILTEIKKRHPLVQVIMLTGYSTVASATEAIKLGAFDYVVKPFDTDRLIALVDEAAQIKRNFVEEIRETRQIPYISERNRENLLAEIMEAAAKGKRSGPTQ